MLLPCGFSGEFGDDKILVTVGFLKEHDQVWGAVWNFRARGETTGTFWGVDPACYLSDEEIADA